MIEAPESDERCVELLLELRRGVHVQLAADREGTDAVLELLALHLEGNWAHRPILPQACGRCPAVAQPGGLCPERRG